MTHSETHKSLFKSSKALLIWFIRQRSSTCKPSPISNSVSSPAASWPRNPYCNRAINQIYCKRFLIFQVFSNLRTLGSDQLWRWNYQQTSWLVPWSVYHIILLFIWIVNSVIPLDFGFGLCRCCSFSSCSAFSRWCRRFRAFYWFWRGLLRCLRWYVLYLNILQWCCRCLPFLTRLVHFLVCGFCCSSSASGSAWCRAFSHFPGPKSILVTELWSFVHFIQVLPLFNQLYYFDNWLHLFLRAMGLSPIRMNRSHLLFEMYYRLRTAFCSVSFSAAVALAGRNFRRRMRANLDYLFFKA